MSTRFILDLKDHPDLAAEFDAYMKRCESIDERFTFLKKQFENLEKDREKNANDFWALVATYGMDKKALPDEYKKDSHSLEFDKKSRQLFMHDREERNPLEGILGMFLSGRPPHE